MTAVAQLLGEQSHVHFKAVESGSTALKAEVETPAVPKVKKRIHAIGMGDAPKDALKAYDQLDEMLRDDNAIGRLEGPGGATIIPFPGRNRPEPLIYGPVKQDGYLDGQIYRIGGKDATIHVSIRDGERDFTRLETDTLVAQELGQFLLSEPLRFYGLGTWYRFGSGEWELRRFKIDSFEVLDETKLSDSFQKLRSVEGSLWSQISDPIKKLLDERHNSEDAN